MGSHCYLLSEGAGVKEWSWSLVRFTAMEEGLPDKRCGHREATATETAWGERKVHVLVSPPNPQWPVSASHWPNPISSQGVKVAWLVSYSFHFSVYFVFLFCFICGGCQMFFFPRLKHQQLICIVVYSCNGILVNHKNECWDMLQHDEPSKPYAEWKTSALKGHILYDPVIWNIQNG